METQKHKQGAGTPDRQSDKNAKPEDKSHSGAHSGAKKSSNDAPHKK